MNATTDLTRLSAENAGLEVVAATCALGPDTSRQIIGASVDLSTGKGASAHTVRADARKARGIPELDSPISG